MAKETARQYSRSSSTHANIRVNCSKIRWLPRGFSEKFRFDLLYNILTNEKDRQSKCLHYSKLGLTL